MKIFKTIEYSKFKTYKANREISAEHVEQLKKSIGVKNNLQYVPILIDEEYRILDGQHRLQAAKELNIPIYYMKVVGGSMEDVILLNANNKRWHTQDYLNMYVKLGYEDYITLQNFCTEYQFSPYLAMFMLSMNVKRGQYTSVTIPFRKGEFKVTRLEDAKIIASKINQIRIYCEDHAYTSREFIQALMVVVEKGMFPQLIDNLVESKIKLFRSTTRLAYLRQMELMVNRKGSAPGAKYVKLF